MIVYVFATLLSCGLAWVGSKSSRRWAWFVAAAVPLMLVSAIRWDVGTDFYVAYFPTFKAVECMEGGGSNEIVNEIMGPLFPRLRGGYATSVSKLYENFTWSYEHMEWGFRQLMRMMVLSGMGFRWLMVLTSLLVGGCVFLAIYRQSRSPVLAVYLYVTTSNYFLGLNIVRQYVAIGFALVAVEFIVRRKLWPFLASIAAGMLFHRTVVVLTPCYLLAFWAIRPWQGFALVTAALGVSGVVEPAALWLLPKTGLGEYCRYFEPRSPWAQDGFEWFFFAINLAFMAFGAWYWKRAKEGTPYFAVWYGMTVIGTVFLAFSGALPLMKRINYYFAAPQFLMLPEILLAETRPNVRKLLTALVVVVFALETAVAVWMFNKNEPLPYGIRARPNHASPRHPFTHRPFGWVLR